MDAVMFFLRLNVSNCVLNARHSNAESSVSFLPLECSLVGKCLVDPLRRVSFEELNGLRNRERRRNRQQRMHMIFDSANGQCFHFVFSRDTAQVWVKPLL